MSKVNQKHMESHWKHKMYVSEFWGLSLEITPKIIFKLLQEKKIKDNLEMLLMPERNPLPKSGTWTSSAYFTRSDNYQLPETSETIEMGQIEYMSWIQSI